MIDAKTVTACRERNGAAKKERASRIDDALSRPKLGHRNGEPILDGYSYDHYPSKGDLSDPSWRSFLIKLFSHYLIRSYEDAATELTGATGTHLGKFEDALQKAANLYDLNADSLFEDGEPPQESRLTEILGEEPHEAIISPRNPMLVGEMYRLGMSVREITDVLADEVDNATKETIRNTLKRCALIDGKPSDDAPTGSVPLEEKDVRLGGTTIQTESTNDIKQRAKDIDGVDVVTR
jgi:hypothetical protein